MNMNAHDRDFARTALRLTRPHHGASLAAANVLILAATLGVSSCAERGRPDSEVAWRGGMVQAVVTMRELDAAIPVCSLRSGSIPQAPDTRVAIVRSRVGKASRDEAFALGLGLKVGAGSRVRFDRKDCVLQPAGDPGVELTTSK